LRRLAVVLGVAMEDLMPVALNDDETPGSAASAED
jgi:hypothetical protein